MPTSPTRSVTFTVNSVTQVLILCDRRFTNDYGRLLGYFSHDDGEVSTTACGNAGAGPGSVNGSLAAVTELTPTEQR